MPVISGSANAYIAQRNTISATVTAVLAGASVDEDLVTIFTEPSPANGSNGWFNQVPKVYIDTPFASGGAQQGYYYSLGTAADPVAHIAQSSGATDSENPVEIFGNTLSGYSDTKDLYVYYGSESAASGQSRQYIPFSTNAPSVSGFTIEDTLGNTITSGFVSTKGSFVFTKVRAFTSDIAVGDYKPRIGEVKCYVDGSCWATLYFFYQSDSDLLAQMQNGVLIYHNRPSTSWSEFYRNNESWPGDFRKLTVAQRQLLKNVAWAVSTTQGGVGVINEDFTLTKNSSDPSHSADENYDYYDIEIFFDKRDFYETASVYYGLIVSDVGNQTRTTDLAIRRVDSSPLIDRLGIYNNQGSGAVIIGNVIHVADVQTVEYTTDSRVPLLEAEFNGSVRTKDGENPQVNSATSFGSSSPFGGSSSLRISSTSRFAFKNSCLDINKGTVEFWVLPSSSGYTSNKEYVLADFAKIPATSGSDITADRLKIYYTKSGAVWRLNVSMLDSFGTVNTVYLDTGYASGASPTSGTFDHVKFTWKFNKVNESEMSLRFNGTTGAAAATTGTYVFGLLPSYDFTSLSTSAVPTQYDLYTAFYLGGATSGSGNNAPGDYADLRVLDVVTTDEQWLATNYGGWSTSGVTMGSNNTMFKIELPSSSADEIRVVKVRAKDTTGNMVGSAFFNTSSCKPILIRGQYSGVPFGDEIVYRFRLIDAQGEFEDLRFDLNPMSYQYSDKGERVNVVSSISGNKLVSVAQKQVEDRQFQWKQLRRAYMLKLKERADSGNSFFLIDHNDKVFYGKFMFDGYDEIVATVPSRYDVTCSILSQGGYYDYRMV